MRDIMAMVDRCYLGDSIEFMLKKIPPGSVQLIVTSPPYNVGMDYEEVLSLEQYREFTRQWMAAAVQCLMKGGRLVINVGNTGRKPYMYLNKLIVDVAKELGVLVPRGEIVWHKGLAVAAGKTSWGSWCDAKNPVTRDCNEFIEVFSNDDCHECIEVFSNEDMALECEGFQKGGTHPTEFALSSFSVWEIPPETRSKKKQGHPAPFPVELPMRAIKFHTRKEMVVLDPFGGSGTTGVACVYCNRHYILIEQDKGYHDMAVQRIEQARKDYPSLLAAQRAETGLDYMVIPSMLERIAAFEREKKRKKKEMMERTMLDDFITT